MQVLLTLNVTVRFEEMVSRLLISDSDYIRFFHTFLFFSIRKLRMEICIPVRAKFTNLRMFNETVVVGWIVYEEYRSN